MATAPYSKDANVSAHEPTKYKHASTVGQPMHPYHPDSGTPSAVAESLKGNFPPPINTSRTDNDQPAANTFDPRTEIQSVPSAMTPGVHSRNGKDDVSGAERGTGRNPS